MKLFFSSQRGSSTFIYCKWRKYAADTDISSAENLLGNSNENRASSAYGRRRHITAPEPPWDAELVAEFRNDPPGIVGHKFLLDRITDACEYTVLGETDGRFLIRAKYNGQQMVRNSDIANSTSG